MNQALLLPSKEVRPATPADLSFILQLQKRFSNELGFLPKIALEWYLENHRVLLATENDEPAGYVLGRDLLRWNPAIRPITQAAIQFDAQRRGAGLALVRRTEDEGREAGQVATQACCREGIDANDFWQLAGYEKICQLTPQTKRNQPMNIWRKQLTIFRPEWFTLPPP